MPGPNPGPALLVAFVGEMVKVVGPQYGTHPKAYQDIARHLAPGFTLNADGEISTRTGEDVDSALADKLTSMRSNPATSLYFVAPPPANDSPDTQKARPLHRMSAREKLAHANGHDPMEYL